MQKLSKAFTVFRLVFLTCVVIIANGDFLFSRHIIGGDVRYTCLGLNVAQDSVRFRVTFTMYRDSRSGGANFDNSVQIGVYRKTGTNTWDYVRRVTTNVQNIREIPANNNDPCIVVPPNVGVEEGIYEIQVWLPVINSDYMFAYQRCCRNPTISNLFNPDETGAAFTITVSPEAQRSCNDSPQFKGFPPVVLCANEPLVFDHAATDVQNDQIVYEFCTPMASGGQQNSNNCQGVIPNPANCLPPFRTVNFLLPGFSFSKPMSGDPVVAIDPMTGIISGTPQIAGQFVVGVCIKEYRNGVLLSSTQRDFQFNVQLCTRLVTPKVQTALVEKDTFIFQSCNPAKINFNNTSLGGSFINSYDWEFLINDDLQTYTSKNIQIDFQERGTFYGKLILNKQVGCKDSAFIKVNIFPETQADFDFFYDTCYAGPVQFLNTSFSDAGEIKSYTWFSGDKKVGSSESPVVLLEKTGINQITLEIQDKNNCRDTLVKYINWLPVPSLVILEPNVRDACAPANISFLNLSKPVDENYEIYWYFSNGDSSISFSPSVTFTKPGRYDVDLKIISPIGCVTEKKFRDAVQVNEVPTARFTYTPDSLNSFQKEVTIKDFSRDFVSSMWFLNSELLSFEKEPVFSLQDTGQHALRQVVFNQFGCSDTMDIKIDVVPVVTAFMPNAFTPNQDGLNDEIKPVGYLSGVKDYLFRITNRWGEKVFETDQPMTGWNGTLHNLDSPSGVYAYKLDYVEPRGTRVESTGFFTLLR